MPLQCRQIPELPGLESITLRGGSAGAGKSVRWPYVAEDRSFSGWISGGELALPLFEQPWSLPMVKVTETIGRAILDTEARDRRTSAGTLAQALVAEIGPERVGQLVAEYVSANRVQEDRELLESWLLHRGNQSAMANALGCHRNTIRNRFQRLLEPSPKGLETDSHFRALLLAHLLSDSKAAANRQPETL